MYAIYARFTLPYNVLYSFLFVATFVIVVPICVAKKHVFVGVCGVLKLNGLFFFSCISVVFVCQLHSSDGGVDRQRVTGVWWGLFCWPNFSLHQIFLLSLFLTVVVVGVFFLFFILCSFCICVYGIASVCAFLLIERGRRFWKCGRLGPTNTKFKSIHTHTMYVVLDRMGIITT